MNKNHSPITKLTIAWRNLSTKDFGYKNGNLFSFLHFICDGCNFDKGTPCYKSYDTLAEQIGVSRTTIHKLKKQAIFYGWVNCIGKSKYGTLNLYINLKMIDLHYNKFQNRRTSIELNITTHQDFIRPPIQNMNVNHSDIEHNKLINKPNNKLILYTDTNKKNVSEVEREKIKKMHGMKYDKSILKD